MDELIDRPAQDATSFLLDGQTVVLEDYLAVRPDRASELSVALRGGRIEAGPWFVLPDELIPSGEALVRNLLAGGRTLRALRAESPPVLYCPDSFGHPAALPAIAAGFGKPLVIVWRGWGGAVTPPGDTFAWSSPVGERVVLFHLTRSGYELAADLPAMAGAARDRWRAIRAELKGRGTAGVALLLNGADHHALQRNRDAAVAALRDVAAPDEIRSASLSDFAADLLARAEAADLPQVTGELRDSYGYTWTLQGTLATRTAQKRRYALAERALVRDVEPWAAMARFNGRGSRRALVHAAWRDLLLCQPHDTLCGCSIDQVARAMDVRLEAVDAQARGVREDSLLDLLGHDRDAARREPERWRPALLVRNRAARRRSGVARVALTLKLADVPVGPGSSHVQVGSAGAREFAAARWPLGEPVQLLDLAVMNERTEAPLAYPDNDAVVRFDALAWVDGAEPYGVAALPYPDRSMPDQHVPHPVVAKGRSLANGRITLRWDAAGRFTIHQAETERSVRSLIDWESRRDVGDSYTPAIRGRKFAARLAGTRVLHSGPLRGEVEQRWRFSGKGEHLELAVRFIVDADAPFLRIHVAGTNAAHNHRLRLRIRTDVRDGEAVADAAFGPVKRPGDRHEEAVMERRVPTAPLHRYVSLFARATGATLYADGLTEYESLRDGFAVTVLRSVGELSRSNLPERPGHAGWPAPTPEAQGVGHFGGELALLLHGPSSASVVDEIERVADDVLYPLAGDTLRSALQMPPALPGVELDGTGIAVSAIKESEDGEWLVLRCVNLLDEPVEARWRVSRIVDEAWLARLDETPLTRLAPRGDTIPITAAPRAIVTVLAR